MSTEAKASQGEPAGVEPAGIDLAAIAARADAATPGPWVADLDQPHLGKNRCGGITPAHSHAKDVSCYDVEPTCPALNAIVETDSGVYGPNRDDATFIAHAREDIPALLELVARLTKERDGLISDIDEARRLVGEPWYQADVRAAQARWDAEAEVKP